MSIAGCSTTLPNLVQNGDYESPAEYQTIPIDWHATEVPDTKEYTKFAWDDQIAHSGGHSVSIAIAPSHPEKQIAYNWYTVIRTCQIGKSYEMTGWVKTENLRSTAWICVQCWNDNKSEMLGFATTQRDYPILGNTDWAQVRTVFTVPDGTAEVCICAGIAAPDNNGGRAWFDGIGVREMR
jgi:hypothetical protein